MIYVLQALNDIYFRIYVGFELQFHVQVHASTLFGKYAWIFLCILYEYLIVNKVLVNYHKWSKIYI